MKTSKKLAIIALAGISVFLTGCSSGRQQSSSSGPITLYWWHSRTDASEETLQALADQFTSANKSIKVEIVTRDPRTYSEDLVQAMAAHQSVQNAPDVFSIDAEDLPQYAPQLAPAPEELFNQSQAKNENTGKNAAGSVRELYQDVVGKSCILKDSSGNEKVYGLPIAMDELALYINKSFFLSAN